MGMIEDRELVMRLRNNRFLKGARAKRLMKKAADALEEHVKPHGTYQCFHCLAPYSVIWDSDYDFEDFGYEGDGIVHMCHCSECGAEIEYRVPIGGEEG